MTSTPQFNDCVTEDSVERTAVTVLYCCTGLPFNNPDAALSQPDFPQLYSLATDHGVPWPNAICLYRRAFRRIDENSCFAVAVFVLKKRFRFGPQAHSEWTSSAPLLRVPVIQQAKNAGGAPIPGWWEGIAVDLARGSGSRVLTVYRAGSEIDADNFAAQIDPNRGLLYGLTTSPMFTRIYQLLGYSMVRHSNNQIIIKYRFRTTAALAAVGANAAVGLDVPLPALDALDGYQPVMNGTSVSVAPFGVRQIAGFGAPLP